MQPQNTPENAPPVQPAYVPPVMPPVQYVQQPSHDSSLAITSMVFGILALLASFTGFGFILGTPAIILGIISLKKHNAARGLSITGIVTGSIGAAISVAIMLFVIVMLILVSINNDNNIQTPRHQDSNLFDSSET